MSDISNYKIVEALEDLVKDKSLDSELIIETLKQAILSAVRKKFGTSENIEIKIDPKIGTIQILATKTVALRVNDPALEISKKDAKKTKPDARVGDEILIQLSPSEFGRSAITVAKQSLIQHIKERERELVYADYRHRVGEIISGMVSRVDKGNILINLGRTEGVILRSEQIPDEHLPIGKTIRVYVKDVRKDTQGAQVILSRKAAEFVKKLFEFEVPEIYEGRVQIVAVSREVGERTKIAVYSTDDRIDPVGACVGLKGTRVQSVVKELSNEKIDIVPYYTNPEEFVKKAVAPAEVKETYLYPDEHKIVLIVPEDQLSLAIGKGGVNARLAARLVGWRLTIYGDENYKDSLTPLSETDILEPEQLEVLKKFEIDSVQRLARMKEELLRSIDEIGDKARDILLKARIKLREIEEENAFVTKDKRLNEILDSQLGETKEDSETNQNEGKIQ